MAEIKMTAKQKRFADEYLTCMDATKSAIKAGYSKRSARAIGSENLTKPAIRAYIDERMKQHESKLVATQEEVLRYLTSVMRGETKAEEIVVEGVGDGCSEARIMNKAPSEKDRLLAADKLSKCYGLYTDREKMKLDRERFDLEKERLELEKQKQSLTDGDDSQSGVVMLAPVIEDDDEEEEGMNDE